MANRMNMPACEIAIAPGQMLKRNVSTTLIHPVREFKLGPLASFEAG